MARGLQSVFQVHVLRIWKAFRMTFRIKIAQISGIVYSLVTFFGCNRNVKPLDERYALCGERVDAGGVIIAPFENVREHFG